MKLLTLNNKNKACTILVMLCLFITCLSLQAQTSFANKNLANIMAKLSTYDVSEDFVGEHYIYSISQEKPLIVQQQFGTTNHIGIKLFDRELINKHPSPLYYFVERYFLELLLSQNNNDIQTRLKQERVKLSSEYYPKAPLLEGIRQIVDGFSTEHSIIINCSNHRYSMIATDGKKEVFSFEFPVRNELITGETKLEAENSLYPKLMLHRTNSNTGPDEVDLSIYKDSLFVYNDEYYMTENIIASSYYKKDEDKYIPVFDKNLLSESVYNLFNASYKENVQIEVTQKMYGNKTNTFTISLPIMMDFLRTQHCQIYSGIRKMDKENIEGVILAVNAELGYQHMMMFTMKSGFLPLQEELTINASMYSYIPIHNVSTLFGK